MCVCACVLCSPFILLSFVDYFLAVKLSTPPSRLPPANPFIHSNTLCVATATAAPYCKHTFVNTLIDARTWKPYTAVPSLAWECQWVFSPLKQLSVWPTVSLNLCRNRSHTEQRFICGHSAVAALNHRKSSPHQKMLYSSIMSWGAFTLSCSHQSHSVKCIPLVCSGWEKCPELKLKTK